MATASSSGNQRAAENYQGEKGQRYAEWQLRASRGTGEIVARTHFSRLISPSDRVLDFGCGGGAVISSVDCRERVGVETNPATREVARSRGVNCFERLDEVPDRSADIVISNHALEHCLEPATELRQIRRVLTPSGRLLLVLPVDDWRSGRRWRSDDVNQHLYGWTPLLIGNLLAVSGFVPERIDLVHKAWPPRAGTVYRVLPWPLFNLACGLWSRLTNHREMRIIASVSEAKA